jgi:tetratricopeptide (TPR) repeat protein
MKTIALVVLILAAPMCGALGQDADRLMYQAYISQNYEPNLWKEAVNLRQTEVNKNPNDTGARYRLALAQFALISGTLRSSDEKLFDAYYEPLVQHLKTILDAQKDRADPHALLAAAYGVKMGYSPMQGMLLGSKSDNLVEKAKRLDPHSPLAWKVYANSKFFTPEMWGGNLNEAIAGFEKAVELYEKKPDSLANNWMYLDALAFLGQALVKKGDRPKAIAIYEKALKAEPEFGWVKHVLLPKAKSGK